MIGGRTQELQELQEFRSAHGERRNSRSWASRARHIL
jgi:hypothetical protein